MSKPTSDLDTLKAEIEAKIEELKPYKAHFFYFEIKQLEWVLERIEYIERET